MTSSYCEDSLKRAGVLELWFEPVYEEVKYEVGDIVWTDTPNCQKSLLCKNGGFVGELLQMQGNSYKYKVSVLNREYNKKGCTYVWCESVRHTTPAEKKQYEQEIKAAEKIEIGGHKVEINYGVVSINGTGYNKTELEYLLQIFNKGQVKSLNVGCSGQHKVEKETIERILSKLK